MKVIDWPELQLSDRDIAQINKELKGVVHMRLVRQALVHHILQQYPWTHRRDTISLFDPSKYYATGQRVALPLIDPVKVRPDAWQYAQVQQVEDADNPAQGKFQVVTLEVKGKTEKFASSIKNANPFRVRLDPDDTEALESLASFFGDELGHTLQEKFEELLDSGRLKGQLIDDYVLFGESLNLFKGGTQVLTEIFRQMPTDRYMLTIDETLLQVVKQGFLKDVENQIALLVLRKLLQQQGYFDLGNDCWTTETIFTRANRPTARKVLVPRVRSRLTLELKTAEEESEGAEADLPQEALDLIKEWDEEEVPSEPETAKEWRPPSGPLRLPTLSYLHLAQGYFPLKSISNVFDTMLNRQIVQIQVVDGERLAFLVNREEGVFKAVDLDAFRRKFLDNGIPAGTFLWLEYQGANQYRIAPHPLPKPRSVMCKLARMEDSHLVIEQAEIPMQYEGSAHLFKAELRFEDMEALFAEAKKTNLSVSDTLIYVMEKELSPLENRIHYADIFNAVFLKRMCSFSSVISTLYSRSHPCFEKLGDGYFRFAPEKGIRRAGKSYKHHPQQKPVDSPIADAQPVAGESFGIKQPQEDDLASLQLAQAAEESALGKALEQIEGQKLHTLEEQKVFFVEAITPTTIEIQTSTGQRRKINRQSIESAWDRLQQVGKLDRAEIRDQVDEFNPAYIAAILAVCQVWSIRPSPSACSFLVEKSKRRSLHKILALTNSSRWRRLVQAKLSPPDSCRQSRYLPKNTTMTA